MVATSQPLKDQARTGTPVERGRPALNGKAPLAERAFTTDAYLLLNLASKTPEKHQAAEEAHARFTERIRDATERYKKASEGNGQCEEAEKIKKELSFFMGLFGFLQMQLSKFISIKNSFNREKENIQKYFDAKINAPRWHETAQRFFPWLVGAGAVTGALTIGADVWNGIVDSVKRIVPPDIEKYVKDGLTLIGSGLASWLVVRFNKSAAKRKAMLAQECEGLKNAIDAKEDDIRKMVLELAQTEYSILLRRYGFTDEDVENPEDHVKAKSILSAVKAKYNFTLPYPHLEDMETNGNGAHKGRFRTFFVNIRKAFSGLFERRIVFADEQTPASGPQDGQSPAPS